jgi:glutathione peroxidase
VGFEQINMIRVSSSMKTTLTIILSIFMSQSILAQMPSIHNLSITDIDGKTISLSRFKGKKILFVNVASECGYTPQYTDLQQLHEKYKDKLVIIGMPCNDFGGQEPGNEAKIKQFCSSKYHVTFMMASKVNIKSNPISPVYEKAQWQRGFRCELEFQQISN